jgi:Common central domain of tyrosinase
MPAQPRRPKRTSRRDEMPSDFGAHHQEMKRFPTADELREMDSRWGIDRSFDPTEFALRLDQEINRLADSMFGSASAPSELFLPFSRIRVDLRSWFSQVFAALLRRRVNHRALDAAARDRFNLALQAAHADGSYQAIAVIHSQDHKMHSMMGPVGTQRFLPWHREYVFKLEDLLRQKQPGVTVPYWDYANDHERPDWVWKPPGVDRDAPGADGGSLPTQSTIDSILIKPSYGSFTFSLELDAHNDVHNWCNGTVSSPPTASQDPIFWLLHAYVDRIWDTWQLNHMGVPALARLDAVMDPWQPVTASDVNSASYVGYSYG